MTCWYPKPVSGTKTVELNFTSGIVLQLLIRFEHENSNICRSYLPKHCASDAELFVKPVEIPDLPIGDRFVTFVRQLLAGIQEK